MKKIESAIFIIVCMFLLTGCKKSVYTSENKGYKEITAIDGVTFEVPDVLISNAAAITQISPDMDFDKSSSYLYKNGESEYLYFNMESIVVAVQKNTDFKIVESKDKKDALEIGNVLGIWFEKFGTKFNYIKGKNKVIIDAVGGLSITNEVYDDYAGKLSVVSNGSEEWSLFVGVPKSKYDYMTKDTKKMIDIMAKSLRLDTKYISDNEISSEELSDEETTSVESTEQEKEEVQTKNAVEKNSAETDEQSETTVNEIQTAESDTKTKSQKTNSEEAADPNSASKDKKDTATKDTIELKNQKEYIRNDEQPYIASIYDMLSIGGIGVAPVMTSNGLMYPKIQIDDLYTGEKAMEIIRKYCDTENALYKYSDAPAGCAWQVIKYSLDYSECDGKNPYVNIKLKGLDGEILKYRGIKYSKKTYDIFEFSSENQNKIENLYCYYAIPNGCTEYALECGTGSVDTEKDGIYATYYEISN